MRRCITGRRGGRRREEPMRLCAARRALRRSERGGIECSPAVAAEFFPDQHRDAALRAGESQGGSAFFTKLGLIPITDSTFCALHNGRRLVLGTPVNE